MNDDIKSEIENCVRMEISVVADLKDGRVRSECRIGNLILRQAIIDKSVPKMVSHFSSLLFLDLAHKIDIRRDSRLEDNKVARAMIDHGGGFFSSLGETYLKADLENRRKIREAFPHQWERYQQIAKRRIEIEEQQKETKKRQDAAVKRATENLMKDSEEDLQEPEASQ